MINPDISQQKSSDGTLARRVGRSSSATMISRVLGYIRDASVAYFFGGELQTDAFYTAFRISNLVRRILGEGSLSSSFVPVFSHALKNDSKEEVQDFLSSLFTSLLVVLALVTVLGILFSPVLTELVAPGFRNNPEKFRETVLLTRWTFPFFFFVALAALVTGVLNSMKHFFLPAFAPAMLSIAQIVYLFVFLPRLSSRFSPAILLVGLSISVVAGGAGHLLLQLPSLFREGYHLKWRWRWSHPLSVQVARLMLPAVLGLSVDQINAFIDTVCASFLVRGSVTALYNSNRLMQLPLALFGISIANVSLQSMSEHRAQGNFDELSKTVNSSLRMVFFTLMPATVGLLVLSRPIVTLLFKHGAFSESAVTLTTRALQGFSIGLIFYSASKIFANAFYSLRIPRIPVRVGVACMVLNISLNLILMGPLGVGGLALSTALSSLVNSAWLFFLIRKHLREKLGVADPLGEKEIGLTFLKTACSCLIMAIFLWGLLLWQSHSAGSIGGLSRIASKAILVFLGVGGGAAVFLFCAKMMKLDERKLIYHLIGITENIED